MRRISEILAYLKRCLGAKASPPPALPQPQANNSQEAPSLSASLVPYDESLLDCARTQWQFGDWESLAKLDRELLQHHPDRAKLALLVAAAHWQLGNTQPAQRLMQLALDWGASQRQVAQLLMAGVHHSLAAAHAVLEDAEAARDHCLQALRLGGVPGDAELLALARMERMRTE